MARKRKVLRELDYQSQEYWNKLLASEGLSVDAGRHPKLVTVGGSVSLEIVEKMELARRDHKVRPTGAQPDGFEE